MAKPSIDRTINESLEAVDPEPSVSQDPGKLKFPLIKNDDSLEYLLNDLLGPDQAKLIMYGSDHASVD